MEGEPLDAASNKYELGKTYSHPTGTFTYEGKTEEGFQFRKKTGNTNYPDYIGMLHVFDIDPGMKEVNVAGQNAKTASRHVARPGGRRRRKTRRRRSTLGRR